VQPVEVEGSADEILRFCAGELAAGWPVIVWIVNRRNEERHAALVVGFEERDTIPHALLLLDPTSATPVLAACNARLESGKPHAAYITAEATVQADVNGAVSIRHLEDGATSAGCV
jgi:DNA polymerase IIIc chi subunit